jgi:hypothetical protein
MRENERVGRKRRRREGEGEGLLIYLPWLM